MTCKIKWRVAPSSADRLKSAVNALDNCSKDFYPIINKLIAILPNLPVSTATKRRCLTMLYFFLTKGITQPLDNPSYLIDSAIKIPLNPQHVPVLPTFHKLERL